jgi:hypothetical protein
MPIMKETSARLVKEKVPYDLISRDVVQSITYPPALAIYVYLLTLPDGWIVRKRQLIDHFEDLGETKWRRAMKLLKELGVVWIAETRNEQGQVTDRSIVVETLPNHPSVGLPHLSVPTVGKTNALRDTDIIRDTDISLKRFTPPTLEQIKTYQAEKGFTFDPDNFIDYWSSVGWKRGRTPMKDWKATARSWARNETNGKPRQAKQSKIKTISISANEGYDIVG